MKINKKKNYQLNYCEKYYVRNITKFKKQVLIKGRYCFSCGPYRHCLILHMEKLPL